MAKLVLASASPRRRELLMQIGAEFEVIVSEVDETITRSEDPAEVVRELALQKARAVARTCVSGQLILGADTIVVHKDTILGKPKDDSDAIQMLSSLSAGWHEVMTGIAFVDTSNGAEVVEHVTTRVYFTKLDSEVIEAYVGTKEPMDKAGAYAIQGKASLFVERIEGCYFNVVGLPIHRVGQLLKRFGINLL